MPFRLPFFRKPLIQQPTDEEAEFFLWLAAQRPRSRNEFRSPYAPSAPRRYPWSPGEPPPDDAAADTLPPQEAPPDEPAAASQPAASRVPPGWTPSGYAGLLSQPEPRGILDLLFGAGPPAAPLSEGLAQGPTPQPPTSRLSALGASAYRGLLAEPESRGLLDRKENLGPGTAPALLPGPPGAPAQMPQVPPRWSAPPAAPARTAMPETRLAQSNPLGRNKGSIPAPRSKPPAPPVHDIYAGVPAYKRDYFRNNDQGQNWVDFIQATGHMPQVSAAEKMIYREIYAAEGGNVPDGTTVAGITKGILPALVRTGDLPESFATKLPEHLTQQERAESYRAYMNDALKNVSGYRTLEEFDNAALAAFMADTVFREGAPEGTGFIHQALNHVLGEGTVPIRGGFRQRDVELLNNLTPEQEDRLADYLAEIRAEKYLRKPNYEGEKARAEHFRDLVKDRTY